MKTSIRWDLLTETEQRFIAKNLQEGIRKLDLVLEQMEGLRQDFKEICWRKKKPRRGLDAAA
jgi:hypothetical protein